MFEKDKTISVTGVSLDKDSLHMEEGDTYTLTATVDQDGKIRAKGPGTAIITVTTEEGKFTAAYKVTVYAYDGGSSSGGSSSRPEPRYDVEMDVTGGSVKLSNNSPKAGDRVTVTLRPDAGMELERIEVVTEDGDTVKLTKVDEDEHTFRQPSDDVTIRVVFTAVETEPEVEFGDVKDTDWFAQAVEYVDGYADGTFGPTDPVTREQLAAILYRYAGKPVVGGESKTFADSDQISSWAVEAMDWAVKSGVLSGKGGDLLDPTGTATRAEVAQILMNFCEGME